MMKSNDLSPIGVIDIGSNSVRLMMPNGFFATKDLLNKEQIITQLASGEQIGMLSANSMLNTANALLKLKNAGINNGVRKFFVFATAAVRNAKNKDEFIKLVKDITGFDIDVVSGEREAELAVLGAIETGNGYVIDIGGASTEVAYTKNGNIVYSKSHKVGSVVLYNKFNRNKTEIDRYLSSFIKEDSFESLAVEPVYAIGGTATCLAFIDLNLNTYDPLKVHGHYMSYDTVKKLKDFLYKTSPQELIEKYYIQEKRANIISGGASILLEVLEKYNFKGVVVSEKDNLEGYLRYLEETYEE